MLLDGQVVSVANFIRYATGPMTPEEAAELEIQRDRLAAYIHEIDAGRINYFNGIEETMLRRKLEELDAALARRPRTKPTR